MIFRIYLLTSRQWIQRQCKSSPMDLMTGVQQCKDELGKRMWMVAGSVKKLGKRGVRGDGEEKWPDERRVRSRRERESTGSIEVSVTNLETMGEP
jgi:hypothetical protein